MSEPSGAPRPSSHRAGSAGPASLVRILPSLGAVSAVALVIVALLILNGRSTPSGPGPVVTSPPATSHSPSHSPPPSATASSSAAPAPPPVAEPSATQSPAVAKSPVSVLNNSRKSGLAREVAAQIRAKGWPVGTVGNFTGRVAETTVYYAPGQLAQAQELAREFPQIKRVEPRFAGLPGHGLTVVVTRDWT